MKERIFPETVLCFLLSGIPIFISYYFGEEGLLLDVVKSLSPLSEFYWYIIPLSLTCGLFLYIKRFIFISSDSSRAIWAQLHIIFSEMAAALFSLLRTAAGLLLSLSILWVLEDYDQSRFWDITKIFATGMAGLAECIWFSSLFNTQTPGNTLRRNDLRL